MDEVGQLFYQPYQLESDFFKKCILVCKLYTVLLPNLLRLNVKIITYAKVDISNNKLQYFQEKSRVHIHDSI